MSKWTMTQANVGLDVAYKPITILLGDSGRSIRVSDESDETDMANARLIAEAPAMAELLQRIINSDMAQMAEDEGRICRELDDARALLARLEADK